MYFFGYHRTSTEEQNLDRGINEITLFCQEQNITLKKLYTDQRTGRDFNRPSYIAMKEILRPGDTLIITELDRLGRNSAMTLSELRYFKDNNIRLVVLQLRILTQENLGAQYDSATKLYIDWINNAIIELFAIIAERDNENRKDAQRKGIEAAKAKGVYLGRKREMELLDFALHYREVLSGTLKPFQCIKRCELKEPTYYRYINEYKDFAKFVKMYSNVLAGIVPEIECKNLFKDERNQHDAKAYETAKNQFYEAKSRRLLSDFLNYQEKFPLKSLPQTPPVQLSPISPPSSRQTKLIYNDFYQRYANLIKGISANNNPTSKERANIMGISTPEFEEHRKVFLNEEFIKSYQEVEQGIITAEDCMAKFGLSSKEYHTLANEYEAAYEPTEAYPSYTSTPEACSIFPNQADERPQIQPSSSVHSTEQVTNKPFIAAVFSTGLSQISNTEDDDGTQEVDEVREYIDNLRAKIKLITDNRSVLKLDDTTFNYLEKGYSDLALCYTYSLEEIQQLAGDLEKYVYQLIAYYKASKAQQ